MIIKSNDPATTKLTVRIRPLPSRESGISMLASSELYGYFGLEPSDQSALDELVIPAMSFSSVGDYCASGHISRLIASFMEASCRLEDASFAMK